MTLTVCPECRGAGVLFGTQHGGHDLECPRCDGTGLANAPDWTHADEVRYHLTGLAWAYYDAFHIDAILTWLTKKLAR